MNDAFAIVYADQGCPDLRELISLRSVSALPLGGRYRAIDFLLSNIANSGVHAVGLITERNYKSLMDHLGSGKDWDLSKKNGGLMVLPPYDLGTDRGIYHGIADAVFAKRDYIDHAKRWCLLLDPSFVYRQDYNAMMDAHLAAGADITMLYTRNPDAVTGDPRRKLALDVDDDGRVFGLEYEPYSPGSDCISLGAMLLDKDLLVRLVEDACALGRYDFVHDVLEPAVHELRVAGVRHEGYVGHLTSVKSYFDVNMDMARPDVRADLFDPEKPLYTKIMDAPPVRFAQGCEVSGSVLGNGCEIAGRVAGSVVFRGVSIAEGADVERCIVMQNVRVGKGCHLRNVIVDKDAVLTDGTRIVGTPEDPIVVRKGSIVEGTYRG